MEQRKAPRKIVRRAPQPGNVVGSYDKATQIVALQLYNTYESERRQCLGTRSPKSAYDPFAFAKSIGDLPSVKRRGTSDNIEDNPDGEIKQPGQLTLWLRVANTVIQNRLDPELFIRRQFAMVAPGSNPPLPGVFTRPEAVANYENGLRSNVNEIRIAFGSQVARFQTDVFQLSLGKFKVTGEQAWARVLNDLNAPLTALFRYCVAVDTMNNPTTVDKTLFKEVADRFRDAAAIQYVFDVEAYDQVWGKRIPPSFRAEADDIYKRVHGMIDSVPQDEF